MTALRRESAVRHVLESYADAVTRRDTATYSALYAPDAVWTIGPPVDQRVEGRDAIVARVSARIANLDFFVFTVGNIVISVQGDVAHCRSTVHELGRAAEGSDPKLPPAQNLYAIYDDELRRDGDRWLFTARRFTFLYRGTEVPTGQAFPIL
ncbi:nuclear transport factor 2 family protein [Mycobacterium arosiense]|uniref:nuclear transport factor 2 family protein n=1 Tax=Mycobacterium arosiense TaxID=425468 RepID=UPI002481A119|nr:nuclear transport factor 2 family protein [Mycobacterium arosiense]